MTYILVLLVIGIVVLVGVIIALLLQLGSVRWKTRQLLQEIEHAEHKAEEAQAQAQQWASEYLRREEKRLRADAVKRSEAVVTGKVAEHLVPFREDFGYNPRDCRFLGSPIDFIVFDGMSEGDLDRVVFVEVKTGLSKLSKRERQLRDVIDQGEVYYEEVRL